VPQDTPMLQRGEG